MTIQYNNTTIPITSRDLDALYRIVSCEATQDSKPNLPAADRRLERMAIVHVILERIVRNRRRGSGPTTVYDVITEKRGSAYQFTPAGKPAFQTCTPSSACIAAVDDALKGQNPLPSPAVYYCGWTVAGFDVDAFAKDKYFVVEIGHARFYAPKEVAYMTTPTKALEYARKQVGCKYNQSKRMQENPNIFDCSSLCYRAYIAAGHKWTCAGTRSNEIVNDAGFDLLYPAKRADIGKKLPTSATLLPGLKLQAGDLIFLCTDSSTTRSNKITHVVMAIDSTSIIHARGTNYGVRVDSASLYATKVCAVTRMRASTSSTTPTADVSKPTTASAPSTASKPTLRKGSTGANVRALQIELNKVITVGLALDGDFGSMTEAAVKAFQAKKGLTVDGIVGPKTWAALGGSVMSKANNNIRDEVR